MGISAVQSFYFKPQRTLMQLFDLTFIETRKIILFEFIVELTSLSSGHIM